MSPGHPGLKLLGPPLRWRGPQAREGIQSVAAGRGQVWAGRKLDTPKAWLGVPQNILTAASSCLLHPWEGTTGNKQEPVQVST